MRESVSEIYIPLDFIEENLRLIIYSDYPDSLYEIEERIATDNGEAKFQLTEGFGYQYQLSISKYQLNDVSGILSSSKIKEISTGRITPNIYVGTLTLYVIDKESNIEKGKVDVEVRSIKTDYRTDYRFMLESITKKCTELLMQINSPVNQYFEPDFDEKNKTIYQRFAFIQSIINNSDFDEAIQQILSSPNTQWRNDSEQKDIRGVKRLNNKGIRQIITGTSRVKLSSNHFLNTEYNINSVPEKILTAKKKETVDTPENRFIKHVLEVLLKFCSDCENAFTDNSRAKKESAILITKIGNYLSHPFFKEISRPNTLKLNSPILQRKSGYREVLNVWLMYHLASKLIWNGGEKVYKAGKRDIAILYEYWLFFTLYDLLKNKFKLDKHSHDDKPYEHLIVPTNDGLNVMVKSGKHTALEGVFNSGKRKLNIKFSYNRTFSGGKDYNNKVAGSWTKTLRPDYTLSIWPADLKETAAEEMELIVHIHFDSKYKVDHFTVKNEDNHNLTDEAEGLNEEKIEERKGIFKNADLLKMHAYKDAIRRSAGAYILYPGTESQTRRGFHEIIPGLGAFSLRPSETNNGINELSDFIDTVINHFLDRASQRENIASKIYNVHKEIKTDDNILNEPIPEYIGEKKVIPDEIIVLIGFYKSDKHLKWIIEKNLYNFRTGTNRGSLPIGSREVGAKLLVLHGPSETITDKIFELSTIGPKIYSKNDMIASGYDNPSGDLYIVYDVIRELSNEFEHVKLDIKNLPGYQSFRNSAKPITVSLTDLMKTKV